jgi:SPP1 gp7 family putative phage head morphogenesis protein
MPDPKITVPKMLLDSTLRHQVYLGRYSNGVVGDIVGLLNDADKDLLAKITARAGIDNFTSERLNAMLEEIGKITQEASSQAVKQLSTKLADLAVHEASWNGDMLKSLTFGKLDIVTPTAERLAALVTDRPFEGALLGEWFDKLAADKQHLIVKEMRNGMVQGETVDQMVRRLAGTKAQGYTDGALEITRRNAEATVRTAVNHTSNAAQQTLLKQNEDLMQGWTFVATLDGRTTLTCASLSGTKWPVGEGPIPPRHYRCRSCAIPLMKTGKQLGL